MFEFGNYPERLKLSLYIGPGPVDTRQKLLDVAHTHHPFKPAFKALGKSYNTIYVRDWLRARDYENVSTDDLEAEIQKKWAQFLEHELPEIGEILKNQEWIWKD